jgi:hypothetical protein
VGNVFERLALGFLAQEQDDQGRDHERARAEREDTDLTGSREDHSDNIGPKQGAEASNGGSTAGTGGACPCRVEFMDCVMTAILQNWG